MEKRLSGIVLKSVDYKETDKLITVLTKEEGKVTFKMRGVRKAGSKLRFATFPFFYGLYLLTQTKNGFVVTAVDPVNRYDYTNLELKNYYLGALVLEIADKLSMEGFADRELFEFTVNSLKESFSDCDVLEKAVYLITDALEVAGHGLNRDFSSEANGFSFDEGGLVNLNKSVGMRLTPSMVKDVQNLISGNNLSKANLSALLSLMSAYFASKTAKKLVTVEQLIQVVEVIED